MPEQDYYSILNVSPYADAATVKKAFRKLAFTHHPDTADADSLNDFLLIQEAYETLIEPDKRKAYDERFFLEKQGYYIPRATITLQHLLEKQYTLVMQLQTSDTSRLDVDIWLNKQLELLSPMYMYLLTTASPAQLQQYYGAALTLTKPLPSSHIQQLYIHWQGIASAHNWLPQLHAILLSKKKREKLQALLPWIAALASILLCVAIFLLHKKGTLA